MSSFFFCIIFFCSLVRVDPFWIFSSVSIILLHFLTYFLILEYNDLKNSSLSEICMCSSLNFLSTSN
ncbi:unnamed protein product [Moneuplotes crassus]|uniref:Uncharacterized protein n=1 Tax=Euplotes crassus TaxID=5936 RepID=A0AAD1Y1W5_EUPCR|nr:unnamed protein product [Moneuplotes crassus]